MSKSVRVDDDIHAEIKELSDKSGIDIKELITLGWKGIEETRGVMKDIFNKKERE